jgi:hypothetical protein
MIEGSDEEKCEPMYDADGNKASDEAGEV